MIVRVWEAQTTPGLEQDYFKHVKAVVVPVLQNCKGFRGAQFTRREADGTIEVLVLTFWESMDAIRRFAGEDESHAYLPREIAAALTSWDESSAHYESIVGVGRFSTAGEGGG